MTLQATKLILKLGGGVRLSAGQATELAKYVSDLEAVADAARKCADMLVFSEGERTYGQVAQRAVFARLRLRGVLRQLDGEGEGRDV